jgi:hypothetical protein
MKHTKFEKNHHLAVEVTEGPALHVELFDEELGRRGYYLVKHTRHSQTRSSQRGINNRIITLAIEYGRPILKYGLEFYVMSHKAQPHHSEDKDIKLKNTVVILSENGQIVTCYKGSNAFKKLQRKINYLTPIG